MEHPPKQGLKLPEDFWQILFQKVLMEHPPKQGLKLVRQIKKEKKMNEVLMEHPPKQGLKQWKFFLFPNEK